MGSNLTQVAIRGNTWPHVHCHVAGRCRMLVATQRDHMTLSLVHAAIFIAALILAMALLAVLKAHDVDPVGTIAGFFTAPATAPAPTGSAQ